MHPGSPVVGIYKSYGRGWLITPDPDRDKYLKLGDWNVMKIQVIDDRMTPWLNGHEMITLNDNKIGQANGIIALQIHSGGGIKIWWRNIKIKML